MSNTSSPRCGDFEELLLQQQIIGAILEDLAVQPLGLLHVPQGRRSSRQVFPEPQTVGLRKRLQPFGKLPNWRRASATARPVKAIGAGHPQRHAVTGLLLRLVEDLHGTVAAGPAGGPTPPAQSTVRPSCDPCPARRPTVSPHRPGGPSPAAIRPATAISSATAPSPTGLRHRLVGRGPIALGRRQPGGGGDDRLRPLDPKVPRAAPALPPPRRRPAAIVQSAGLQQSRKPSRPVGEPTTDRSRSLADRR